jgi:hypothetical protein
LKNALNRQIEGKFKNKIIATLPAICKGNQLLSEKFMTGLKEMLDFDNADCQQVIGKSLS